MNSQNVVSTFLVDDKNQVNIIKKCSEPNAQVLEIYQVTKFKLKPFSLKKFALPK